MYEELVERLRHLEITAVYHEDGEIWRRATAEAADAIEELSREYESIAKSLTESVELVRKMQSPRWIPVTEQLPEEYTEVLCYYEYFRYGDYNCMFRTIDRGYFGDGRWGGEAGQGRKNKVLAWMPLPEPSKEEDKSGN